MTILEVKFYMVFKASIFFSEGCASFHLISGTNI
jgi:hypothetical protein